MNDAIADGERFLVVSSRLVSHGLPHRQSRGDLQRTAPAFGFVKPDNPAARFGDFNGFDDSGTAAKKRMDAGRVPAAGLRSRTIKHIQAIGLLQSRGYRANLQCAGAAR